MAFRQGARAYIPLLKSCKAAVWTSSASKSTQNRYFVGERLFELPELKLLVDAVESSRFITAKKSERLIEKLGNLTSESQPASWIGISIWTAPPNRRMSVFITAWMRSITPFRKTADHFPVLRIHTAKRKDTQA